MSNRLFQGIVSKMKDATDRTVGVVDENGIVVACSDPAHIGELRGGLREEFAFAAGPVAHKGVTYRPIGENTRAAAAVFASGEDPAAGEICSVLAVALSGVEDLYEEKTDRASLLRDILLENILPGDLYQMARERKLDPDATRVVYIVRFAGRGELLPYEMVLNLFPDKDKDTVLPVGECDVVLVRESEGEGGEREMVGRAIADTLASEFYAQVTVGIGMEARGLKDLPRSYKEAQMALEVGKIFDGEKAVHSYEKLGIGRLIYQLPASLCEMFLQEVYRGNSIDALDREILSSVKIFFENNLNVAETARRLFIHRNTLVYRFEKVTKVTGLDLRRFEDAVTFYVAMMVRQYVKSMPEEKIPLSLQG